LAVSEPSQLLENDFWHEAAAKSDEAGKSSHDTQKMELAIEMEMELEL